MVCPVFKAVTAYARAPKIVTDTGVASMGTFMLWEDVTKEPKVIDRDHPDYDWLDDNPVLRGKRDVCKEEFENCKRPEPECNAELLACLKAFHDYH